MDRNQRSRRQKSMSGSYSQAPKRSMGSRMGLEKPGTPRQQPPKKSSPRSQRTTQQINPQTAGYDPAAPKRQRRVTQAEIIRKRNRRRAMSILAVLAVLAVGAFVSLNLLFKVAFFRVENFDRTIPADTGIYTSDELINALNIEKNSNLFGFSTAEKTRQLAQQFPYLEQVQVEVQMPATVVVKVQPAVERFACMYSGGWMMLSDSLKILRTDVNQPDGLILLSIALPTDFAPTVGQNITPESYNSLLGGEQATAETAGLQASAMQTLTEMLDGLQTYNLFDGTTAISVQAALDGAAKITIFNRSDASENAELIRKATGCQAEAYSIADTTTLRQKLEEADLLVNATNVGMGNLQGQCLIPDASYLHHGLFVADIIYNPKKTALLAMAEQAGLPTANGLGMLLYQGAGAFRLWTGQDMPVDVVKRTAFPEL